MYSFKIYNLQFTIPFILLLLFSSACSAQKDDKIIQKDSISKIKEEKDSIYNFIQYDKNKIKFPENLKSFYEKLDSLKKYQNKKINIVHIGDSHIQPDILTGKIRHLILKDSILGQNMAGRGYFFPTILANAGHEPVSIETTFDGKWKGCRNLSKTRGGTPECAWGLAGMTATTDEVCATVNLRPREVEGIKHQISTVRIYYPTSDSTSFYPLLWTENGFIKPNSIFTEGFAEFILKKPAYKVSLAFSKHSENQTQFTLQGISFDNNAQKGISYHSVGVNGAEVGSFLKSPKLIAHLQTLSPDLMVISLGTNNGYKYDYNETELITDFENLLKKIQENCPNIALLLTTPADTYFQGAKNPNKNTEKMQKQLYILAEKYKVAVWDLYEIMGGLGAITKWQNANLAHSDRVHYKQKGYQLQGKLLFEALLK